VTLDLIAQAIIDLNKKRSINIEFSTDSLDYFELTVEPLKLRLQLNETSGSLNGIFTVGMVKTKDDAQKFIPKFLKQFDGLPIGPFLISHSGDEVGCLIENQFTLMFQGKFTEAQVLRELEQQTVLAAMILTSLAGSNILFYPDIKVLDKYKLNIDQELYNNVMDSGRLLKSV